MKGSTYIKFEEARLKAMQLIRTGDKPSFGLLIITGISTGLRYSDLIELTYGELRGDSFTITEKKTGKERKIIVSDHIKVAMEYFKDDFKYPDNYKAFRSQKGSVYSNKSVNRLLQEYFKGDRISSHSLRKSFGRRVYNANGQSEAALMKLSEIFAHRDIATTRKYLGLRQEELDAVYLNL
ncbi:tyrosine-type recombinase/integrase [Psychroflexus sp. YR1-1]|uniref:Tyrosine-type recombinase/integrase n=1 Tax=Psychroflexus aurantiacus TaxID=2709310 RepID=A0A6B3R1N6_9FLAO|nr:tyrosine-type recombinase/integrase [Psychroflexus aurantiacus]NEV94172.1 tyrosine-type recombinase/integrase [Psychroflexus aurantiacus]